MRSLRQVELIRKCSPIRFHIYLIVINIPKILRLESKVKRLQLPKYPIKAK